MTYIYFLNEVKEIYFYKFKFKFNFFFSVCNKKCKSCKKMSFNCLECTGSYRSSITPNCNCTKGYYEPMNSDILSCLSIFCFTKLILIE